MKDDADRFYGRCGGMSHSHDVNAGNRPLPSRPTPPAKVLRYQPLIALKTNHYNLLHQIKRN